MCTPPNFNATNWLKEYFKSDNLNLDQLRSVLEFTLIWNVFEEVLFDRYVTLDKVRKHVYENKAEAYPTTTDFTDQLDFLRQYYSEGLSENSLANHLLSTGREHDPKQRQHITTLFTILSQQEACEKDVIFGLLFFAIRIRNNLFHGEKKIYGLKLQNGLFITASSILATYLTNTNSNPTKD